MGWSVADFIFQICLLNGICTSHRIFFVQFHAFVPTAAGDKQCRWATQWCVAVFNMCTYVSNTFHQQARKFVTEIISPILPSFYYRQFEGEFNRCLKNTSQLRHIIAFPVVCGEFLNCSTPFCQEEVRGSFRKRGRGRQCMEILGHRSSLLHSTKDTFLGKWQTNFIWLNRMFQLWRSEQQFFM